MPSYLDDFLDRIKAIHATIEDEIETFVHSHAGTEIAQDVLGVAGIAAEAGTALGQPEVTAVAKDVEDVVTDVERDVPEPPPDNNG